MLAFRLQRLPQRTRARPHPEPAFHGPGVGNLCVSPCRRVAHMGSTGRYRRMAPKARRGASWLPPPRYRVRKTRPHAPVRDQTQRKLQGACPCYDQSKPCCETIYQSQRRHMKMAYAASLQLMARTRSDDIKRCAVPCGVASSSATFLRLALAAD